MHNRESVLSMWIGRKSLVTAVPNDVFTPGIPALLSILPNPSHECVSSGRFDYIQWYDWWVRDQVQKEPTELFSTLQGYDPKSDERFCESFVSLWKETSLYVKTRDSTTIDDIIAHLVGQKILRPATNSHALLTAENLVFAIIGWQTMLYRPSLRSCPPAQLAIVDEMDGHRGQAHLCLKQNNSACKRSIYEFLLGFGVLLPPRNFNAAETPEDKAAFNELKTVAATSFNAHFLVSIGAINIKWIDSLACHLEFDACSNTLFVFRFPSFCVLNLPSNKLLQPQKSVLHACAAPYACTSQWATTDEVTQMLQETILSYRLLFGQNKAARQLFRRLEAFDGLAEAGRDEFLNILCGQKHCRTAFEIPEREIYDLIRDFPILRSRIAMLLGHISNKKPRTWKELWQDKRDSASWLTFWAVLVIGGMGIILALLQVILQIVQITQHP